MPQIQAEAVLVAVRQRPRSAHLLAGWRLAQAVGIGGAFDLDDLGAQVGEQPAQLPAGDDDAEVQDAQTVERSLGQRAVLDEPVRILLCAQDGSSAPANGAGRLNPAWCPSTTNEPTGTATRMPGASSASVNAPTARKCSDVNASAGVSTAAIGTPRACPSATKASIVCGANSSAMTALSSRDAAYRAAIVSYFASANCSGSPSHALMPRHWRG